MKLLCLTPIDHIPNIRKSMEESFDVKFAPYSNRETAKKLISSIRPDCIFVNPNKQTYVIDEYLLDNSSIKFIGTASTGLNHIDINYCKNKDIEVISLTTDYEIIEKISSTAEHAFALTLSAIRSVPSSFDSVKNGMWDYEPFVGRQMNKLKIGVIGYGRLGRMYSKYCKSFGSEVFICDPYKTEGKFSLEYIMSTCDVISIHVHLCDETANIINEKNINTIKSSGAYIINTSRGGVVNEEDIIKYIYKGKILGYATDVVCDELVDIKNSKIIDESRKTSKIIITPHIGGMTIDAQEIAYGRITDRLKMVDA